MAIKAEDAARTTPRKSRGPVDDPPIAPTALGDGGEKQPKTIDAPPRAGGTSAAKRPRVDVAARRSRPPRLEGYYLLVERFPLQPIRDEAHLDEALETVEELMGRDLDEGSESYLSVLASLIEAYERKAYAIPDASEADVLRVLMGQKGINQTELQGEVGISQSTISAVLRGSRHLTKGQIVSLARFFQVPPAVFMPRA
jgi:HTH-type transcriptional regulator/antitoxin HigA